MAKISGILGQFAKSLDYKDLPKNWADDPAIVAEAERLWKEQGTESPFFKAWFDGSQAVDANGKPEVRYHGTNSEFDTFDKNRISSASGDSGYYGAGFYTTPDKETAKEYGSNIMELYAREMNPENFDVPGATEKYMQAMGYEPHPFRIDDKWLLGKMPDEKYADREFVQSILDGENPSIVKYKESGKKFYNNPADLDELARGAYKYRPDTGLGEEGADWYRKYHTATFDETPQFIYEYPRVQPFELADKGKKGKELTQAMKDLGYDSAWAGWTSYPERVVFEPEQLKSVNNRGTFNPEDPNIYRGLIGVGTAGALANASDAQAQEWTPPTAEQEAIEEALVGPVDFLTAPIGVAGTGAKALSVALTPAVAYGMDKLGGLLDYLFGGSDEEEQK